MVPAESYGALRYTVGLVNPIHPRPVGRAQATERRRRCRGVVSAAARIDRGCARRRVCVESGVPHRKEATVDALFLIGRFLFGLLFVVSGAGGHLAGYQQLGDPMARQIDMTQFMKDLALLGASLVFFAVTAYGGEFGPMLTDPLFDL